MNDYHLLKYPQKWQIALVAFLRPFRLHKSWSSLYWVWQMFSVTRLWGVIDWRLLHLNSQRLSSVASFSMLGLAIFCSLPLELIHFETFVSWTSFLWFIQKGLLNCQRSHWNLGDMQDVSYWHIYFLGDVQSDDSFYTLWRLIFSRYYQYFYFQYYKSWYHIESFDAHLLSDSSITPINNTSYPASSIVILGVLLMHWSPFGIGW